MNKHICNFKIQKIIYFEYFTIEKYERECARPVTLSKKWLWHRCFLVNFAKSLRTPILQNNSRQLLLEGAFCNSQLVNPVDCFRKNLPHRLFNRVLKTTLCRHQRLNHKISRIYRDYKGNILILLKSDTRTTFES